MAEPTFPLAKVDQVGIVVRDLRRAMDHYVNVLGIGPWRVYTYGASLVRRRSLRGQPADFELYLAFCQTSSVMLELIEPRGGPSLHAEFLVKRGEGIHHLGVFVPNLEAGIARAGAAGFDVLMSGQGTVRPRSGALKLETPAARTLPWSMSRDIASHESLSGVPPSSGQ